VGKENTKLAAANAVLSRNLEDVRNDRGVCQGELEHEQYMAAEWERKRDEQRAEVLKQGALRMQLAEALLEKEKVIDRKQAVIDSQALIIRNQRENNGLTNAIHWKGLYEKMLSEVKARDGTIYDLRLLLEGTQCGCPAMHYAEFPFQRAGHFTQCPCGKGWVRHG